MTKWRPLQKGGERRLAAFGTPQAGFPATAQGPGRIEAEFQLLANADEEERLGSDRPFQSFLLDLLGSVGLCFPLDRKHRPAFRRGVFMFFQRAQYLFR